ncbi:MAG: tetratricopeptide repeat protein [Firmicutes bacterium]|nr:tetratricopeptide repeat protein [Bacillota bacterium]
MTQENKKQTGAKKAAGGNKVIFIIIGIILIAAAVIFSTQKVIQVQQGSNAMTEGKALMQQGKYDDAAKKFREYNTIDPNNEEGYVLLSRALMAGDHKDEAYYFLEKGLKKFPKNMKMKQEMGNFYVSMGQNEKAKPILAEVLKENPKNAIAQTLMGMIYVDEQIPDKAYECFKTVTTIPPTSDKETSDAVTVSYKALLEIIGNTGKDGNDEMAIVDQAIEKLPEANKPRAYVAKGIILFKKGDMDKALENFKTALEKDPAGEAWANYPIAAIYEKKGDKEKAVQYYKEFLKVFGDPKNLTESNLIKASIYKGIEMNELPANIPAVQKKIEDLGGTAE